MVLILWGVLGPVAPAQGRRTAATCRVTELKMRPPHNGKAAEERRCYRSMIDDTGCMSCWGPR
jgi:hypothetical protein